MPGLEYSSGEDSDMDMGEEMGEEMGVEMGEAVDMGEKRNFVDVMSRQKPRTDAAGMWQCEVCSHHKRCKAVQSVHHLLHVAAAQLKKAIRVAVSRI